MVKAKETAPAAKEVHRPLGGAAKAAHEAKLRGEPVRVPAAAARSRSGSAPAAPATPATKRTGILERLARII